MEQLRLKAVQAVVDGYIENSDNPKKYYTHSYGVSAFAAMLAARRGLNQELASIMGLLHDISAIHSGTYDYHDLVGSKMATEILSNTKLFTPAEIGIVAQAILRHDARSVQHDPYDEALKDADILWPHFTNLPKEINPTVAPRVENMLQELNIKINYEDEL